jgi:hypothetical protein
MRKFLLLMAAIEALPVAADAATLYVDASGKPSAERYERITDAIGAAQSGDTILVAPGVYSKEDVPILITTDGITIQGSTVFTRDERDFPTGVAQSTASIVKAGGTPAHDPPVALVYVTGEDVTIRGLVLDGQALDGADFGIVVDGLVEPNGGGFDITENMFSSFYTAGLFTRGASGTIEGNLMGEVSDSRKSTNESWFGAYYGIVVAGGRESADPVASQFTPSTVVTITRNRFSQNSLAGLYCQGDRATVPFPPDEESPGPIWGALLVHVVENDFVHNGNTGLSLVPHANSFDFSQGTEEALLVADVRDNTFGDNYGHGLAVYTPIGSQFPEACAPAAAGEVWVTLDGNLWYGNEANDARFAFTSYSQPACYVHDNKIQILGDVPEYDHDAPLCVVDPVSGDCPELDNQLLVNGTEIIGQ